MRKETTYYAFDGTEFRTESGCLEYERDIKEEASSVIMLNEDFEVVDLFAGKGNFEDIIDEVMYIKVLDGRLAGRFFWWVETNFGVAFGGLPEEFTTGEWWAYDNDEDYVWYNPVERRNKYADLVVKLESKVDE